MNRRFLSIFTCLLLICSINFAVGADERKEVTIMLELFEKSKEAYTISGSMYTYDIRLMGTDICDKELCDGTRCINTIELDIVQKNKYTNEVIKTVTVPDIIKVRDMPMNVEFEDMRFDDIYVFTIYFDRDSANFKMDYTIKDPVKGLTPVYAGEMGENPFLLYFGEGDKIYTMNINRSGDRLITNVRDNLDSKTVYGLSDDVLSFGSIMVKVLNQTSTGIKFTVYSSSNIENLERSNVSLRKGETGNIGGMDFKITNINTLTATITVDGVDHQIKKRSLKGISNYIFELNDIGGESVNLYVYHPPSVSLLDYQPNVTLTVTKKLEPEEGDVFEIPFSIANTGKVGANNLTINLEGSEANIIDGAWKGTLEPGEVKELKFKAKFNTEGEYLLVFNVDTGQSSEGFQSKVNVRSKVTSILKEGPMASLIYITRGYILTPQRMGVLYNSINIFLYIGILLSAGILLNSARQKLPQQAPPNGAAPKGKVVKRRPEQINQVQNGAVNKQKVRPSQKVRKQEAVNQVKNGAVNKERVRPRPEERKDQNAKRRKVKKRE